MTSFTAEMYKSLLEDLHSKSYDDTKSSVMRMVSFDNTLNVAFAIHKGNELRALYLSVNNSASTASLPKWKGVSFEFAKLPEYGSERTYLVLKELPNSVDYIFDIVAEDLRKTLEEVTDPDYSFDTIFSVLCKWKIFFQYDGEVVLSEMRQQGLMGELCFLAESIQEIGQYSVSNWAGSNNETHDFYFNKHAVEVKTTSAKEPYNAHISSEYQLDIKDVPGNLYLKFFAFRKSQSAGTTLPQMVNRIREMLLDNTFMLKQFNDKLQKYGYFDEVSEIYSTGYYLRDEYQFLLQVGFPCIESHSLRSGVGNVEYSIEIEYCKKFRIKNEDLFIVLRGGMTRGE